MKSSWKILAVIFMQSSAPKTQCSCNPPQKGRCNFENSCSCVPTRLQSYYGTFITIPYDCIFITIRSYQLGISLLYICVYVSVFVFQMLPNPKKNYVCHNHCRHIICWHVSAKRKQDNQRIHIFICENNYIDGQGMVINWATSRSMFLHVTTFLVVYDFNTTPVNKKVRCTGRTVEHQIELMLYYISYEAQNII